jgi:hypothetical protein
MSTFASGVQGGQALFSARYKRLSYTAILPVADLNAGTPITFPRVVGPQTIYMRYKTGAVNEPTWSFSLKGGTNTTASEVLPIFPNPALVYDGTIQYRVDATPPPRGAIIQTLPPPPITENTVRVNIFRVLELMSGLGLTFDLAFAPFASVDPMVTLLIPAAAFDIEVEVVFFRTHPNLRNFGSASSFGAPIFLTREYVTNFPSQAGVNPLDDMALHEFKRYNGQQDITLTDLTTGYYFSFEIDYGIISQGGGYIGLTSPTANGALVEFPSVNCTVQNVFVNVSNQNAIARIVNFLVSSTDGRQYIFTVYADEYIQQPPTIRMVSPTPFGADDVEVRVTYRIFVAV